jgi:hypothetical protein
MAKAEVSTSQPKRASAAGSSARKEPTKPERIARTPGGLMTLVGPTTPARP